MDSPESVQTDPEGLGRTVVPRSRGIGALLRGKRLQVAITVVGLVVWLLFVAGAPSTFLQWNIYSAFLTTTPYFGLVAVPLTLVVIAGEIDLSFGSVMAWGMTVFALIYMNTHNEWLAFAGCLIAGLLAGGINGILVVGFGIPSLIATIGTQFFWAGVALVVTNAQPLDMTPTLNTPLYSGVVGRVFGVVPMQFVWMVIIGIGTWILLNRTRFGAHVYLVGDNIESARLMGVNVGYVKIGVFALVGVAAAFAGFVQSSDVLTFWPTMGQGNLLQTLAAVFLGGTSVFGGFGTVYGTFVGAFIINGIQPGIVASGLTGYWTQVIYGFIIVVSLAIQGVMRRRSV